MKKKVSVIIPHFNLGTKLVNAVDSVLSQSYKNIEVVIVDDKSTTSNLELCRNIAKLDPYRIKLIELDVNKGVSNARNVGIKIASGDFVTFLDADDQYSKDKILNELSLIEDNSRTIAFSNIKFKNEQCVHDCFNRFNVFQGSIVNKIVTGLMPCPRDILINRNELVNYGTLFNIESNLYEDLEFVIDLSKNFRFEYTNEVGTIYNVHGGGLSSVSKKKHQDKLREILREKGMCKSYYMRRFFEYNLIGKYIRKAILFLGLFK